MVIGFIFAWLPGIIYTVFKFKYADELKDLQWGDGKWEFWIRKTHNVLGFIYGFSLYRNVLNSEFVSKNGDTKIILLTCHRQSVIGQ